MGLLASVGWARAQGGSLADQALLAMDLGLLAQEVCPWPLCRVTPQWPLAVFSAVNTHTPSGHTHTDSLLSGPPRVARLPASSIALTQQDASKARATSCPSPDTNHTPFPTLSSGLTPRTVWPPVYKVEAPSPSAGPVLAVLNGNASHFANPLSPNLSS